MSRAAARLQRESAITFDARAGGVSFLRRLETISLGHSHPTGRYRQSHAATLWFSLSKRTTFLIVEKRLSFLPGQVPSMQRRGAFLRSRSSRSI